MIPNETPPIEFDVALRGFDRRQVATLIERVLAAIRTGSAAPSGITAAEARGQSFDVVLRGFDRKQVTAYLSPLISELERREHA